MHSLARITRLYHPSPLCSARSKKKSDQEHEEGLSCHGHAILLITVENNRRQNQNHSSKYFFLISQRMFLENHGSWLLMKSQFTRKKTSNFTFQEEKHRPSTNYKNTIYHPQQNTAPWVQEKHWIKIFESKSTDTAYWTRWGELLLKKVYLDNGLPCRHFDGLLRN